MSIWEILLIGAGLSMDAFAVSVCKGLASGKPKPIHYLCVALWFGGFQALMPSLGYLLGSAFEKYITAVDHWIAFVLLGLIGGKMLYDGIKNDDEKTDTSFGFKSMLLLAVATSIDALAIGITFALMEVNIFIAAAIIGVTTALISAAGLKAGSVFGAKYKARAEIAGGIILILIGIKILLEHLDVINF